jgi:hypothetical protein
MHGYLNGMPADFPASWKSPFYDLYGEFSVNVDCVPFVLIHIETTHVQSYEQRLGLDMRHVSVEGSWKTEIEQKFREEAKRFFRQCIGEEDFGKHNKGPRVMQNGKFI